MASQKRQDFIFYEDKKKADQIKNLPERLLFLNRRLADYLQTDYKDHVKWVPKEDLYNFSAEQEIKYVEQLMNFEAQHSNNTPMKHKETPFLKWQKNSVLLAYLLNELKKYGFIDDTDFWKISEEIFRDKKGNKIKNTTFSSLVKTYENNQTPDGTKGKPKAHTEITTLIESLRKISEEIK